MGSGKRFTFGFLGGDMFGLGFHITAFPFVVVFFAVLALFVLAGALEKVWTM